MIASRSNVAARRPPRRTTTRSESPISSGRSDDTTTIASPVSGEAIDLTVDFLARPYVHAPCRLVEQQDAGNGQQPSTEQNLLLVAAGEVPRRVSEAQEA